MRRMLRGLLVATLCLLAVGALVETRAEVSVRTDRYGNYLMTQVITTGPDSNPRVWTIAQKGIRRAGVLNPRGDRIGDLWPEIQENLVAPHYPWVVWSRPDGLDHGLVWSRWADDGWERVRWVEAVRSPGDNLDPRLAFDSEGRPYLAWWREEVGRGTVYISVFLLSQWMDAYQVSPEFVDGRNPSIWVTGNGGIHVEYETPAGVVSQDVLFTRPVTITDDINPQNHMTLDGEANIIRKLGQ